MTVDALADEIGGQQIERGASLLSHVAQHLSGNGCPRRKVKGIQPMSKYYAGAVGTGDLPRVLQCTTRTAVQVGSDDNGLQTSCKTHSHLLCARPVAHRTCPSPKNQFVLVRVFLDPGPDGTESALA